MTTSDCVYCKEYMDDIGCDTKTAVRKGTWCGQCKKGRDALYGHWDTYTLKETKEYLEAQYDLDPINWGNHNTGITPDGGLEAHWRRLRLFDLIGQMSKALDERKKKK